MESSSKVAKVYDRRPPPDMRYLGVRVTKRTYDAIIKMQQASPIDVSITAVVQHLLDKVLGFEKENGKKRRQ